MARLGFKKTYPAGAFNKAAVESLFGNMKTYVTNAGFNVLLDTPTTVDFIRAGFPAGMANDDVAHWGFEYLDEGLQGSIRTCAVYGAHFQDVQAYAHWNNLVSSGWYGDPPPEITVWFCVDSAAGWWWLHGTRTDTNSTTGMRIAFCCVGATSRRYPSDMHQGLGTRYGLWDTWGDWEQAYCLDETGVINTNPWTGTWSPFGEGWTNNGIRHPASPMPKMAVPQFPNRDGGSTACILGEFNEILILTDGYASEEMVVPGWIAMVGSENDQPYAVPAPVSFDVL